MLRSQYLEWYVHTPKVKHDLRSSGITGFRSSLYLSDFDFSVAYGHGNPEASTTLARRFHVDPENICLSGTGASGQNTLVIRCIAEKCGRKNEAIVEFPTYEPLLRKTQKYFATVKRLERKEEENYRLDVDALKHVVSDRTGLLMFTNPHAPSGAVSSLQELKEVMAVAREYGFHVLCDEIYAEFSRETVPTLFSVDPEYGVVTTSFTKAYGLGGVKLGLALADGKLVDTFYMDMLNSLGPSSNIVQQAARRLLENVGILEAHKERWVALKREAEKWLRDKGLQYFPCSMGVTLWVTLPVRDSYRWVNEHAIPRYSLATVPGAFFLFKNRKLARSNKIRLSLGSVADSGKLREALHTLARALKT